MIDYPPPQAPVVQQSKPTDQLREAIATISQRLGGVRPQQITATPVTRFRASYAQVLKEVDRGAPQVVVQGNKRFVVFSEEQVVAFADLHNRDRTVGELLQGLPLLEPGTPPLRSDTPEPALDQYRLGART